jgi:phosphoribosylformimino-5-aminoimidazole carboxamide ribotide isomerase
MDIIPVIDVCGGRVVDASGGDRTRYRPIESRLVAGDHPSDVAAAMLDATGSERLYVADIGAYLGHHRDWQTLKTVAAACAARQAALLIDLGLVDAMDAIRAFETLDPLIGKDYRLIVALESLRSIIELERIVGSNGPRTTFSLDLVAGSLQAADETLAELSALAVAELVMGMGVEELIVLDTSTVGAHGGPSGVDLCRQIRQSHANVRILSGGGIRHRSDVRTLLEAGCDAVLVATALHRKLV